MFSFYWLNNVAKALLPANFDLLWSISESDCFDFSQLYNITCMCRPSFVKWKKATSTYISFNCNNPRNVPSGTSFSVFPCNDLSQDLKKYKESNIYISEVLYINIMIHR